MTAKDAIKRAQNDARISSAEVTKQREQCELAQILPSRDGTRCNHREHARPTVKEIFDLRKQGRIEEAYEAIRPMYAAHKGRYTSLCMFWTAADVFKLRLEQHRIDEATKILEALKRMLPRVEEIIKELDAQKAANKREESQTSSGYSEREQDRPQVKAGVPASDAKLPWESNASQQSDHAAKRFIQYAEHRLASINSCSTPSDGFLDGFSSDIEAQRPTNVKDNPINPVNPCSVDLNPGQQTVILDACRQHGWQGPVTYDRQEEDYDW